MVISLTHDNVFCTGACEGSLACSTCHVVLEPKFFEKLPEPVIEEEDMLDLAFGLTRT
jgi:ferredoxin, 2Fe-2S